MGESSGTGIGLCLPQLGSHVTPGAVRSFCEDAEALGYASLWVQDHFLYPVEPERGYAGRPGVPIPTPYRSVWAPLELLTAAAAWTTAPKLGTSILVAGNHWPVPLAHRLATVDQLSGGRLLAGFGVGWNAEEHTVSGSDIRTRGRRFDDFIPALLAAWADDPVSYEGEVFSLPPSEVKPKPVQRPRPPLISGMWSPVGLDRTRRLFDGWNPAGLPVAKVAEMVAALDADRPAGMAPLDVYYRVFVQPPHADAPDDPIAAVADVVAEAREAGFREVVIEANFWAAIASPDDWRTVPDRLAVLLS